MRRSKSNPAKYARNYRKISQRKMTAYDDLDEDKEMQRLKNILKHSEDHLKKHVPQQQDDSGSDGEKEVDSRKRHKHRSSKTAKFKEEQESAEEEQPPSKTTVQDQTEQKEEDEDAAFERARALLRNSTDHIKPNLTNEVDVNAPDAQLKPIKKKSKKRSRPQDDSQQTKSKDDESKEHDNIPSKTEEMSTHQTLVKNPKEDTTKDSTITTISGILSDDFLAEHPELTEGDLVILPKKKKPKKAKQVELSPEEIKHAKQVKKKTERKLKQLSMRSEQKIKRTELYGKLQQSAITEEERNLLLSSSTMGKRVSKKEQLKRLVQKERAGIPLTEEERDLLYRDRGSGNDRSETEAMEVDAALNKAPKGKIDPEKEAASKDAKQTKTKKAKDMDTPNEKEQGQQQSAKSSEETKAKPASDASSFASQMMASLTKLKVVSELQKEELEKEEQEEAERKRLEEERKQRETKGAPYKVTNTIKIQTAATNKNLPVHELPTNNRRVLTITRPKDVEETRYDLPVTQMEYEVMDAIRNNDVTIVCGETGSGKSTQIPQLLYESGFSLESPGQKQEETQDPKHKFQIAITQPRRVAAVSTAKRVCHEMGFGDGQSIRSTKRKAGNPVAYQTRYETAGLGEKTRIKFMTDGILLQEIQSDLLLRKYSVIVLDECHERNLNCDILCGLIGLALPLRKKAAEEPGSGIVPLKLVIMSATLRVDDFVKNSKLFPSTKPFVVKVPGRTFPVTIHHSRVTELEDYEDVAFRKICKIHRKLPQGGVLVFLTGKQEIVRMVKRLRKALATRKHKNSDRSSSGTGIVGSNDVPTSRTDITYSDETGPRDLDDDEVDGDLFQSDGEDDFDVHVDDDDELLPGHSSKEDGESEDNTPQNVLVLPLYSMMSTEDQAKVFAAVPEGTRLIVCASNIAETSITLPSISYVVDTGRHKTKSYDAKTGVASFDISWISKAAANQRAGRAGRTGPGHCYRLYSSSMFARHMDDFALPEVLTRPLEDVVLAMKAMKISSITKFPFPTPPAQDQIDAAVSLLANLGCIDLSEDMDGDGQVTRLGAAVSTFPLGVRCGKMLLVAAHAGVLDYAIAIVAAFSEKNPFVRGGEEEDVNKEHDSGILSGSDDQEDEPGEAEKKPKCKRWVHKAGDIYAIMLAVGAYTYAGRGAGGVSEKVACKQFCEENGLNPVIMERIQKIRVHLSRLVKTRMAGADGVAAKTGRIPHNMKPPNKVQEQLLMQVIVSGLLDNVAMLAPLGSVPGNHPFSLRSAFLSCSSNIKEPLFMDRNSVLYSRDSRRLPLWICYDYIIRKTLKDGTPVATMKNVTPVDTSWLGTLAKGSHLLSLGGPVPSPRPHYDPERDEVLCAVETKFGRHGWEISPVRLRMHDVLSTPEAKHSVHFHSDDNYRYFARFLLEGKVVPEFKQLGPLLNDNPSIITGKTPVAKVGLLVSALSNAGVDSASALRRHWSTVDNKFLFKNLKGWVKQESSSEAKRIWIDAVRRIQQSTS